MATAAHRDHAMPRWQRALLPAVEGSAATGPHLRRSLRDWVVDLILFTFAVAVGAGDLHSHLSRTNMPLGILDVTLAIAACCSLWVRRRHPLGIGLLTLCAGAVSGGAGGAAIVGLFTIAVHCAPRWTAWAAALSLLTSALNGVIYPASHGYGWGSFEVGAVGTMVAVGYGLYVHARRELVLSLRERARRLESEQDLRVREARAAERTRIAREMHDVLAHRISLLSVHAGALEYNPSASPEEIARAAAVIRTSARAAQEELREVIGILRAAVDDEDEPPGTPPPPQPTLVDVPELIAESKRAGMEVTSTIEIDGDHVPQLVGRTAYRLVQEGLTNARKHAPGQQVSVTVAGHEGGALTIEVVNRPKVGHAPPPSEHARSGTGLIGLAERVGLAGGRLSHRARPDGGFVLDATLPWPKR